MLTLLGNPRHTETRGHLSFDDALCFCVHTLNVGGRRIALLGLNSAYGDNNVYFRVDTTATPEQSQIDIYVDNDGSGGCQQEAGRPGDTASIYDLRIIATYSAGWSASVDTCPAGSWVATGAPMNVAVVDVAEFSVTRSDFGTVNPMAFFVRYGTSTDYAPDSDDPATLVELVSFTAKQQAGGVQVAWETASEVDNAGFNLYRSDGGEYAKLNAALIPAQGGPTFGASYAYDDVEVVPGMTYTYMLEDVDIYGQATLHGPVSVEVGEMPTAVEVHAFGASSAAAWLATLALMFDTMGLAWTWRRQQR